MSDFDKENYRSETDFLVISRTVLLSFLKSYFVIALLYFVYILVDQYNFKLGFSEQSGFVLVSVFYSLTSLGVPFLLYIIPMALPVAFYVRGMVVRQEPLLSWLWKGALYYFLTITFFQTLFLGPEAILGTFLVIVPIVTLGALLTSFFCWQNLVYRPQKRREKLNLESQSVQRVRKMPN